MTPDADRDAIVLGVDIGGTKTSLLALTAGTGRRLATTAVPTPCDAGPAAFVAFLRRESDAMLDRTGADPRRVGAVGCAVPGQVDGHGLVLGAGNLEGWSHVPLRELIEDEWHVPAFVEQDANAGALGEMWRGAARTMTDFVFLALGTGIGAGIVIDRRIHRGAHHAAGEIGDLVLDTRALGRAKHHLTSRIGSRALQARALEATGHDVLAADVMPGAPTDARLAPVARDMANDLVVAVIAIAAVLDPEAVVFGGGTAAGNEELLARVREQVTRELWSAPSFVLAALGEESQLHGAVAGAMARLDPHGTAPYARRRED